MCGLFGELVGSERAPIGSLRKERPNEPMPSHQSGQDHRSSELGTSKLKDYSTGSSARMNLSKRFLAGVQLPATRTRK